MMGTCEKEPMRITLVISSLSAGGAERVMSYMANYWAKKGWAVTLITMSKMDRDFFPVEDRVVRVSLGLAGDSSGGFDAILNNVKRLLSLRSAIQSSRPDVVISFMESVSVLTLLATRFTGIPVIVSEHNDPHQHNIGKVWGWLRRRVYPQAAALVVLTQNVLGWAVELVGEKKAFVIPNSITRNENRAVKRGGEFPQPFILAVGRLAFQKGFEFLLQAFKSVSQKNPEWSLVILGEGSERASLEAMVKALEIEDRVHLPGRHADPMSVMEQAPIFVMSSRYEGFPIVLLEALACGTPSISFNCPSGPSDVIRHGIDGILVPPEDVGALADAMQDLMTHPEKREKLALRAKEVTDRFGEERVMGMWETLIETIQDRAK